MAIPARHVPPTKLLTARELSELPEDLYHGELVRGVFMVKEPTHSWHGEVSANIVFQLRAFVEVHKIGRVYGSDVGFILARDPDTVRAPDAAFVRTERLGANAYRNQFFPIAPDLAVEVLSPSERRGDINEKIADYRQAGTPLLWVVSPKAETVTVHRIDGSTTLLTRADMVDGEHILPGFRCPVLKFFED